MTVGFVGLGKMGAPMARHLVERGDTVVVWNRTPKPFPGSTTATSIADLAKRCEVVFTMLADDAAVESVVLGDEGLVAGLAAGAIHVSCSTITVELAQRMKHAHAAAKQHFVGGTVFGRPTAAENGALSAVLAGPSEVLDRITPLVQCYAQRVDRFGDDPIAAHALKLAGNSMIIAVVEMMSEAAILAEKHGVPRAQFLTYMNEALFKSPFMASYGDMVGKGGLEPPGMLLRLFQKDSRNALAAADDAGVPMPMQAVVFQQMAAAVARGMGDEDATALIRLVAQNAGLPK